MAASGSGSKGKPTPVPAPTSSSNANKPGSSSSSSSSIQVLIKASPNIATDEDDSTIKVAPPKNKDKAPQIKLKKPPPKHHKAGDWRHGSVIDDEKVKRTDTPSTNSVPASPGPVVNPLDDSARETFATGRPLEDNPELQQCKHCKKSILKTSIKAHLVSCLKAKKEKAQRKKEMKEQREREKKAQGQGQANMDDKDEDGDTRMDDDDDDGKGFNSKAKKSAGKKVELEKGKKRKAEGEGDKAPKAKKKKEEPKKVVKQKGPVDVERQCGVLKDGVPCARSLTCKSHSMGAKRAVPGRSLPYDMLLTAYQKKNQAKQQKAAIDANAPLEDEEAANGPVDSDEELAAVQHGLSNWNPQPVVPPLIHIPIERTYQKQRLYEQLHNATNGFSINIFKVKGYGAQRLPPNHPSHFENDDGDADGEPETPVIGLGLSSRRGSTFSMQQPPQRRPSIVSQR